MLKPPALGFGLGLRVDHYEAILADRPEVDWFEVLTENYLVPGGKPLHYLMRMRERYPLAMHGVSMSIGSTAPLDREYLDQVRELAQRVEPAWISDHLCWTGVAGRNTHDLLPLPYTEEALGHVAERVRVVQEVLGRRILLENVSSYVAFRDSSLTEWDFLREVADIPRIKRGKVPVALVANRLKPWTNASQQAIDAIKRFPFPIVAELRDTQGYVLASELGKSIFDYNSEVVRSHQDDWAKLLRWLKKVG